MHSKHGTGMLGCSLDRTGCAHDPYFKHTKNLDCVVYVACSYLPPVSGCCSNMVALNAGCNALNSLADSTSHLAKLQVLVVDNNR